MLERRRRRCSSNSVGATRGLPRSTEGGKGSDFPRVVKIDPTRPRKLHSCRGLNGEFALASYPRVPCRSGVSREAGERQDASGKDSKDSKEEGKRDEGSKGEETEEREDDDGERAEENIVAGDREDREEEEEKDDEGDTRR